MHAGAVEVRPVRCSAYGRTETLEQRVQVLTETRAETVDHSAAELRRLERDLHDGAQARLVALSMSLGMADAAFETRPRAGAAAGHEARADDHRRDRRPALGRPRHPPAGARRPRPGRRRRRRSPSTWRSRSRSTASWPGGRRRRSSRRSTSPSPSAWPTSASTPAPARLDHAAPTTDGLLRAVVGDDGRGGADPERRNRHAGGDAAAGRVRRHAGVSSPAGGPTIVTLEVPCVLSSPKTTPSSGPA